MTDSQSSAFDSTVLGRLAGDPPDEASWKVLVDRYGPHVIRWAKDRGCPESDTEDILQGVLIKLLQAFKSYRYDRQQRFRTWLATVTQNAVIDYFRSRQFRLRGTGDSEALIQLQSIPARQDLCDRIHAAFDVELFEKACDIVRDNVQSHLWQTFELTSLRQLAPEEAAHRLGVSTATLYVSRSRVLALVKAEVARMQREIDGEI